MVYAYSRIKPLRSLLCQFRRSYHYHHQGSATLLPNFVSNSQIRVCNRAYLDFTGIPSFDFPRNVRFFAAPVQAKPKQEQKEPSGPRLNEKIKADVIRLVIDEGHEVVSRMEALRRASNLKLDLVEVDRNAKPPVCKIMDFHREKYNKKLKEKDRAKSKSEGTLRKGDCKEVRFAVKTEQKDLEIKANTIKRLMERGYRVKCMAMGTEEDDLGSLVARVSALIEDVAIIESGPRVEKKQAYIVVRHMKFGPSKKGGSPKKASKAVDSAKSISENADSKNSSIEDDETENQPDTETDDESPTLENRYKDRVSLSEEVNPPVTENRYKRADTPPVTENRYKRADTPPPETENRYKRADNPPVTENRYARADTPPPVIDNRYRRPENSPVVENRYNRGNNSIPAENRYNRGNNSIPAENRYNRANNSPVTENRYNRENNSPVVDNRYRRDHQYNPNVEGGRDSMEQFPQSQPNNSRFPTNDPRMNSNIANNAGENRYRNGNNFDPTRHPRPQGDRFAPPYSDSGRQS